MSEFDKVIVMADGRIKESFTPKTFLPMTEGQ
jgi:ABC-type multidrug transport system fused ATPase/permease subunit